MTRLAPNLDRSLLAVGDVHHYAASTPGPKVGANSRAAQLQRRTLALGDPAAVLQIGDIVELGMPAEHLVAEPWWGAWPDPKVICFGNHDVGNGFDMAVDWEARYGDRTQVLDTPYFRVVSCGWNSNADGGSLARCLNTADGLAELDALIGATSKPTVLAFHYALRASVPSTESPAFNFAISAGATANLATLIGNNDNLQAVLTGHTHSIPLTCANWGTTGMPTGTNGRRIQHHNISATTYVGALVNANVRSQLNAFYFTFYDDHFEARIRDIEGDQWVPRWYGTPKVERYDYT